MTRDAWIDERIDAAQGREPLRDRMISLARKLPDAEVLDVADALHQILRERRGGRRSRLGSRH